MKTPIVEIGKYTPLNKGYLKGFFNMLINIDGFQIQVNECTHFMKEDRQWFSFPSKQYDKKDGTKGYSSYVRVFMKEQEEILTTAVMKAIGDKVMEISDATPRQTNPSQVQDDSPFVW